MSSQVAFAIALDGPAASGKSTVGLGVARELGFAYFDTGLLYRALTWLALDSDTDPTDAHALCTLIAVLEGEFDVASDGRVWQADQDVTPKLHEPRIDALVSTVAAHGAVRSALVPVQRRLVRPPGMIMAGRDIGTVILPDAPLKIWLNASLEERARRRSEQTGEAFESVRDGMVRRDHIDGSRSVAPMARADDAVEVSTDGLTPEQVIHRIVELARARGAHVVSPAAERG